jgi:hypothetical protein
MPLQVLIGDNGNNMLQADGAEPPNMPDPFELRGNGGNDVLIGNNNDDILDGGEDDDNLQGGLGSDLYKYNVGDGSDRIGDLGGNDTLLFGAGITMSNLSFSLVQGNYQYPEPLYDLVINVHGLVDQGGNPVTAETITVISLNYHFDLAIGGQSDLMASRILSARPLTTRSPAAMAPMRWMAAPATTRSAAAAVRIR